MPQVISASVGFVKVELHDPDTQLGSDGTLLFSRDVQSSSSSSRAGAEEADAEATEGAGAAGQGASSSAAVRGEQPQAQHAQRKAQLLPRRQLLCNVRSLLRKLSKKVLVGDHVQVCSIDWTHGRGSVQVCGSTVA